MEAGARKGEINLSAHIGNLQAERDRLAARLAEAEADKVRALRTVEMAERAMNDWATEWRVERQRAVDAEAERDRLRAECQRLREERDQLARKVSQARSRAAAGDIARAALNPPKP